VILYVQAHSAKRLFNQRGDRGCELPPLLQTDPRSPPAWGIVDALRMRRTHQKYEKHPTPQFPPFGYFWFRGWPRNYLRRIADLIAMLRRRSTEGMNPRMAAIIGCFQVPWIYYGILIISRPVVVWNLIGVCINFFTVFAYRHFARKERLAPEVRSKGD